MKDKKTSPMLIVLIVLILILLVILILKNNKKVTNLDIEPRIVTDYSLFYTISNCVSRYIDYVSSSDTDSLYIVLNDEYKEENNITKDNILSKLDILIDNNYNFQARKMYYLEQENNYVYYVYGYLREESINKIATEKKDYYVIVNVDKDYEVFNIRPYDGEIFKEK